MSNAAVIQEEYYRIINDQWGFMSSDYPFYEPKKCHRTELKPVKDIHLIKNYVLKQLGFIPVFFFLVVIFSTYDYPGPYRHVEKGLLILYHLLSGSSLVEMGNFIPRSSYFAIYQAFFEKRDKKLHEQLDQLLSSMCTSLRFRILCALNNNPKDFKIATMFIDGHDTRASLSSNHDSKTAYSYKFKKSGLRIQFLCDINLMIMYISKAAFCGINNDGSMLSRIDLSSTVTKQDVIALDGGYTQYIPSICSTNPHLSMGNFLVPKRKAQNIDHSDKDAVFNSTFGSFRSSVEDVFGKLGSLFKRFNNNKSLKVTSEDQLSLQYKLVSILFNIKRFASLGGLNHQQHHESWLEEDFDFPNPFNGSSRNDKNLAIDVYTEEHIKELVVVEQLQLQFLQLGISNIQETAASTINVPVINDNDDDEMSDENNHFEIDCILDHRGKGKNLQYLVKWKGYSDSSNKWVYRKDIHADDILREYHCSLE